ncbi:MAG: alpha/beta hydrolase [Candidatus Uhrbacteria bacterium]
MKQTINRKLDKFHIGNSIGDFLLAESKPKGIIILCEGMPALPERADLMNRFCRNGYHVFLPRYQGTWENSGTFLKHSPAKEIRELCKAINDSIQPSSKRIRSTHFILIGTSFGGSVAIDAADHPSVRRVIALSPVIDFALMPDLKTLGTHLKEFYPGAYRFEQKDWNKLLNGKLIQPLLKLSSPTRKKIQIILGGKDTTISPEQIKLLPITVQKQILTYPAVGHISFSKITEPIFNEILKLIA